MPAFLKKIVEFFKKMPKGQRIRLIILVCVVIVIVAAVTTFLNQKNYSVLYSGMDPKDAGDVLTVLEGMGVDAVAKGDDTILVESSQVDKIRMQLSAQGYPESGFNFDIFQQASGLGTTDMEKKVYLKFQLEANLRQTIKKLDKVEDAVVNLNLSEDSPFALSNDNKPASAAVLLTLKNGQKINNNEVRAIGELVAKSVSGLKLEDVRIVDSQMNLYKIQDEDETENVGTQLELQQTVQKSLKDQVLSLLNPVFGEGKVLAEINVVLDFDKQTSESQVFTPPVEGSNEGIAVSMQQLAETVKNGTAGGVSGVSGNTGTPQYPATVSADPNSVYNKITQEANYEINETKTQIEKAKGQIKDLSVSVILDSSDNTDDYTDQVKSLVANAIGVSADKITVEMLAFKKLENTEVADAMTQQKELLSSAQNAETLRLIIMAAAALIVMLILLAIVKTMRKKKAEPEAAMAMAAMSDEELPQTSTMEFVAGEEEIIPEPVALDVNFEAKDTNLSQLEKYIDKSPESVAQLLRNWLSEDYGR